MHIFSFIYRCFECIIKQFYWIRFTHNIKNYPDLGQCYPPQPSALADNIDLGVDNS